MEKFIKNLKGENILLNVGSSIFVLNIISYINVDNAL